MAFLPCFNFCEGQVSSDCSVQDQTCVERGTSASCEDVVTCTDGDQRCVSNAVETCNANAWSVADDCAAAGETCVESGNTASCQGGELVCAPEICLPECISGNCSTCVTSGICNSFCSGGHCDDQCGGSDTNCNLT